MSYSTNMDSIIPQLLPLEFNSEKKRKLVLENTIKMLTNRGLLDSGNLENNIKKILSIDSDDMLYTIKLDHPELYYSVSDDTNTLFIKILPQKITGISKNSNIGEFILTHKNNPKIIIVNSITPTARDNVYNDFQYTEVFLEKDLIINIVDHVAVPKHELLSEQDTQKVLEEYMVKKKNMPKIYINDPVSRYFNAKIGRIFRIIGPSETSGLAPYYRLVIKGNIVI